MISMKLIPGRWYWVRLKQSPWFPAKHSPEATGGWTDGSLWQDTNHAVVEWQPMNHPEDRPEWVVVSHNNSTCELKVEARCDTRGQALRIRRRFERKYPGTSAEVRRLP